LTELRSDGRRRSDEALRQSEERYRRLVDLSPDAVVIIQSGRVVFVNPAGVRLLGAASEDEIVGRPAVEFVRPDERAGLVARMQQVLEGERPPSFIESRYIRFDGTAIDLETAATLYPDPDGPAIQVILRDITERKRAEAALRESEERFREIAETIDEVFWITSPDKNRMIYVSPAYEKIWGRPCADLYANPRNWLAGVDPDDRDRVIQSALTRQEDGSYDEEYRIRRPDGTVRWIRDRAYPLRGDDGAIGRIVGLAEDITERKRVEAEIRALSGQLEARVIERTAQLRTANDALRQAESRQRALLDAIPDLVFRLGRDGTYLDFSAPRGGMLVPPERIIGSHVRASGFPEDVVDRLLGAIERAVARGGVETLEYDLDLEDAQRRFEARLVRSGEDEIVATVRDITDRKRAEDERSRLEAQLRQAQKMEAIGTLAGGIAHDFNNILTAIIGHTELLRAMRADDADLNERLAEIAKAGSRAKELVAQILTFSRRQERTRAATSLGPVVLEALKLLRAAIPTTVEIEASVAADLPAVLADATQVHQVIMNLAANAAAAISGHGGRLKVALDAVELDEERTVGHPALRPGGWVRLTVEDDGCGMEPDVIERIFDPFFTTKGPGEGTGLGLSVVHGIVTAHEGAILVESRLAHGTTFRIFFPAISTAAPSPLPPRAAPPRGRGEHVLCVDDEPAIVELLRAQLEMLGYTVTAHTSPLAALADFLARPGAFDAVVTDLTMPALNGADLVERLLVERPDLPVVMATGHGRAMSEERARDLGIRRLLLKPFAMAALAEAVHDALPAEPGVRSGSRQED
jgi:PAS domain S-box-containing protein